MFSWLSSNYRISCYKLQSSIKLHRNAESFISIAGVESFILRSQKAPSQVRNRSYSDHKKRRHNIRGKYVITNLSLSCKIWLSLDSSFIKENNNNKKNPRKFLFLISNWLITFFFINKFLFFLSQSNVFFFQSLRGRIE